MLKNIKLIQKEVRTRKRKRIDGTNKKKKEQNGRFKPNHLH